MHRSLFSLASALTILSYFSITTARVAELSPRYAEDELDKRLVCVGDSLNEVFVSVGMGNANDGAQHDIVNFCRSWIDIPAATSYYQTVTLTTTSFPATVTVDFTTEFVLSASSTVTVTSSQTEYALRRRSLVRKDGIQERAPAAQITQRAELPKVMVLEARRMASSATKTLDVVALGAALSSACSCKSISPTTDYLISTARATRTIGATDYRTATVNSTLASGVTTVTQTVNLTSTIRPTGTGGGSSGTMLSHSYNHTMTGTGTYTRPTYSHSSYNNTRTGRPTYSHGTGRPTYSRGTGTSGWPRPTMNSTCLPCSTGSKNFTATVTAFSTGTVYSTVTDVVSDIVYKNQTVTKTEGSVTITASASTVTLTGATLTETITQPGATISLPASITTVTETLPASTVTITDQASTITEAVVTEYVTEYVTEAVVTDPTETSTATSTATTTEARYRPYRN